MRAESERQNAEENLRVADSRVQMTVDELDTRFEAMVRAYADLKAVFSNEDSSRASMLPTQSTPLGSQQTQPLLSTPFSSRPTQRQTLVQPSASPSATPEPRGPISMSVPQSSQPPSTQNNFPAYVVYSGKDGMTGIFYSWHNRRGLEGAKQYITSDHHLVKGFGDVELAQEFYNEFVNSSAAILLSAVMSQRETFVLLQGVLPGVYHSHKALLWKGLQFRGGVVERFTGSGSAARARQRFSQAQDNDEIRSTHQPRAVD
ncbi:hypothetical protein AAF712_015325 [Marasmius tenuissimus]|uniref:Uncharacterized protein n=1 Tax=Marasmius tenuissimus TaxID=585030 RepID=A0ABR2Z9N7_9AGAR